MRRPNLAKAFFSLDVAVPGAVVGNRVNPGLFLNKFGGLIHLFLGDIRTDGGEQNIGQRVGAEGEIRVVRISDEPQRLVG